jgi:eukaryotic-like serine/threonine-protein kinase
VRNLTGSDIGGYSVLELIGSGGMGAVYRGVHARLNRTVAIKVVGGSEVNDTNARQFLAEARMQASLRHPGIATLYDFIEHDGQGCIVMEFVEGPSLAEYIQSRGPLKEPKIINILQQVSEAVCYLHGQKIIHRDLKPANIKLCPDGAIKLLDFGISQSLRALTNSAGGSIVGTFEYSAPECLAGKRADQRSDIWSLGVLLYEMGTGRLPFSGNSLAELTRQIHSGHFTRLSNGKLDHLLSRCLQPNPLHRFANIEAFQAALSQSAPLRIVNARMLAIGALAAVLLTILVWRFLFTGQPSPVETAATKFVNIDAINGPAEVFRDGRDLGATPLRIHEQPGRHVSLMLRRDGFADLPVDFDVTERSNYSYVLHAVQSTH